MRLLLDTHALIWYYQGDPQFSLTARQHVAGPANSVFVSAASHWEIAIKLSTGKLTLADAFPDFVQFAILDQGFTLLPIEPRHTAAVATLPYPTKHRDPFDRLLIAQALTDGLTILSADPQLDSYSVTRLW